MHKVLVIEQNPNLKIMYAMNLVTYVGAEVHMASNSVEAIDLLALHDDIKLVICRAKSKTEETAKVMAAHMQNEENRKLLIVIGDDTKLDFSNTTYISSGLDIKEMVQNSARCLEVTAKDMVALSVPDYFPVPVEYAADLKRSVCNIYVEKDGEHELLIELETEFPPSLIFSLSDSDVKHIYVNKMQRLAFCNNLTQELVSLVASGELNEDEQVSANQMGQELVGHKLATLGVTPETVELANNTLKQIASSAKGAGKMSKLLKRMLKNKSSYLFKHTQVLTYLGMNVLKELDWGNNPEQMEKFSFIAFFHDISLKNDQEALITSMEELKAADLSPEDAKRVEQHAMLSAELIHKYPKAPMGSDQIIKQHHGMLNGIGYSETYAANLSPITIVFALCENITDYVITNSGNTDVPAKIAQMRGQYTTQRFQKIIDIIERQVN